MMTRRLCPIAQLKIKKISTYLKKNEQVSYRCQWLYSVFLAISFTKKLITHHKYLCSLINTEMDTLSYHLPHTKKNTLNENLVITQIHVHIHTPGKHLTSNGKQATSSRHTQEPWVFNYFPQKFDFLLHRWSSYECYHIHVQDKCREKCTLTEMTQRKTRWKHLFSPKNTWWDWGKPVKYSCQLVFSYYFFM